MAMYITATFWPCVSQQPKLENQARLGDPPASARIRRWLVVLRRPWVMMKARHFGRLIIGKKQSILNVGLFDKCVEG